MIPVMDLYCLRATTTSKLVRNKETDPLAENVAKAEARAERYVHESNTPQVARTEGMRHVAQKP